MQSIISRRKRPDEIIHPDKSPKIEINSQTKFVIVFNQSPQQSNSLNHLFKVQHNNISLILNKEKSFLVYSR